MKKLLAIAAVAGLSANACLVGDPNPYDNVAATGGNGSGGASTGLRSSVPPGSAIAPGAECSTNTSKLVSLTFTNTLSKTFSIYWVGFACEETLYGTLAPLGTYQVQSYEGHPFRLRDETGALLYEYLPSGSDAQSIVIE